jgi:hypothetical protein
MYAALHGTLGSYVRDALQEGSDQAVACPLVPRAYACGGVSLLVFSLCLVFSTAFSCKEFSIYTKYHIFRGWWQSSRNIVVLFIIKKAIGSATSNKGEKTYHHQEILVDKIVDADRLAQGGGGARHSCSYW